LPVRNKGNTGLWSSKRQPRGKKEGVGRDPYGKGSTIPSISTETREVEVVLRAASQSTARPILRAKEIPGLGTSFVQSSDVWGI